MLADGGMKTHISTILVAALLALPGCVDPSLSSTTSAIADPPVITLLHVNDTHSHLDGLTRAASVVAAEKASNPSALFVHAGDLFHGDLYFNEYLGVPELQVLQSIGLDVFTPGNHEYQFGPEFLAGVLQATWPAADNMPIVDTNVDLSGYPVLGNWVQATAIKDVGGVKVGFLGLTTPYDPLERPAPVVISDDLAGTSQQAVDQLRADGAQVVVCLAHLGLPESRKLAEEVTGLDVIVNGHDHVALASPETVGTTLIVSAGEYYRWVGRLRIAVQPDHVDLVDYNLIPIDNSVPALPQVQAVVTQLRAGITARYGDVYHHVIGWAREPVLDEPSPHQRKLDTGIGDLFTDGYRAWTGTDIAIEANGFLDQGLPAGRIVRADVYRSMSYGLPVATATGYIVQPFRLATFRMTGAQLLYGLEAALAGPGDLFPQVSGMRFMFDSRKPAGARVILDSVRINGKKLAPAAVYTVTANEGMLLFFPLLGIQFEDPVILPDSASGAVQALIEARRVIDGDTSGRVRDLADRGAPCRQHR